MINYARFLKINPDTALERTNQKFTQRFNYLEAKAQALGKSLHDMTWQKWMSIGRKRNFQAVVVSFLN